MSSNQQLSIALEALGRAYLLCWTDPTHHRQDQLQAAYRRVHELFDQRPAVETPAEPAPIPMVLQCPMCQVFHIDEPNEAKGWTNPPHRSHECQFCGCVWRPADVPTTGVLRTQTRGKADTWPRQLQVKTGGAES